LSRLQPELPHFQWVSPKPSPLGDGAFTDPQITQITQISRGASFWKNLLERGVLEANNFEEKRQQALAGIVGPNPAKSSVSKRDHPDEAVGCS
jgi:hypothetical protein